MSLQGDARRLISHNTPLAIAAALSLIIGLAGIGAVTQRTGEPEETTRVEEPHLRTPAEGGPDEQAPDPDSEPQPTPGSTDDDETAQAAVAAPEEGGSDPTTAPDDGCVPEPVEGTGITSEEVTIGQIVTDVAELPQQLGPANEGLEAFVQEINERGGVCGRRLRLEYRNDRMNPATHRSAVQQMSERVFAFVGNESLLESQSYEDEPPFEPTYKDGDEYVPDVGGLAFSYGRAQSAWHAGVVGSLSPVLVGGGQVAGFIDEARERGTPCRKGAIVYLREPSGASEDQARLLEVAVREPWGGDLGEGNTELYAANLLDPTPAYEVMVDRMVADGMNCVFSYTDLGSSINLVRAMHNRGVWPPDSCDLGPQCFQVVYIPLSAYDRAFIRDGGEGARDVSTYVPHVPLSEPDHPALREYRESLKQSNPDARPSTFSILGYASGRMFADALRACGAAPTRACVMEHLRALEDFTAGGLLGAVTPFESTRASFGSYGTHDWKWIFDCSVALRVGERNGERDFYRIHPDEGFFCNRLRLARGTRE